MTDARPMRKISELKLDPENLRHHGRENIEMIKKSLSEYGQYKPIIAERDTGIVRIGNGRLQAMIELGWKECWCEEVDFNEHPGMEILDNRLSELSSWVDPSIDTWLLEEKGVEWWGVDTEKAVDLLKVEKRKERKRKEKNRGVVEPPEPKKCPKCGGNLKRQKAVFL